MNYSKEMSQELRPKFHKENRRFEPLEDRRLKELVETYGDKDWSLISNYMPGRNRRQCKDRWEQYLSPHANNTPWTEEEETLLINLVKIYENDWVKIAKMFPGRPLPQIRNKWRTLKRRISNGYTPSKPVLEPIQNLFKQEHQLVPVNLPQETFDNFCPNPDKCTCVVCRLCGKLVC